MNKMQEIYVEKVTLNMGTGEPGDKLDKAMKLLKTLTNSKPVTTKTKKRIPGWGIRPGLQIGCKVTLRGKRAHELLVKLFAAKGNNLRDKNFDDAGNVSFGIPEYLDIPGAEYDMEIGIIGLEAAVTLARPGFRIKKRRIMRRSIPKNHRIGKEDAIKFVNEKYGVEIGG
ncbi:MAG: 50S ribosomal protein L5 [Candidatus Woesearchaeota archaeon]